MKTSLCAIASDAIKNDFHLEEFIKWHCPLFDEVLIELNKRSTDDTKAVLLYMRKMYPNLKLVEQDWGEPNRKDWLGPIKREAFTLCTGELRLLLDVDEFFADAGLPDLQKLDPRKLYAGEYIHFVGSYKTVGETRWWPSSQWRLAFSTLPIVYSHISTDSSGSNLIGVEPEPIPRFRIYHFGTVRDRIILLKKWQAQMQRNYIKDSIATMDWATCAEGQLQKILAIEDTKIAPLHSFFRTPEFVRDNFALYTGLKS